MAASWRGLDDAEFADPSAPVRRSIRPRPAADRRCGDRADRAGCRPRAAGGPQRRRLRHAARHRGRRLSGARAALRRRVPPAETRAGRPSRPGRDRAAAAQARAGRRPGGRAGAGVGLRPLAGCELGRARDLRSVRDHLHRAPRPAPDPAPRRLGRQPAAQRLSLARTGARAYAAPEFANKSNVPAGTPPSGRTAAAIQRQIAAAREAARGPAAAEPVPPPEAN